MLANYKFLILDNKLEISNTRSGTVALISVERLDKDDKGAAKMTVGR
jgi:hypothetical protein